MANKKIKAEVHINEPHTIGTGVSFKLDGAQASLVLERMAAGDVLNINLVTNGSSAQKDFDYSQ